MCGVQWISAGSNQLFATSICTCVHAYTVFLLNIIYIYVLNLLFSEQVNFVRKFGTSYVKHKKLRNHKIWLPFQSPPQAPSKWSPAPGSIKWYLIQALYTSTPNWCTEFLHESNGNHAVPSWRFKWSYCYLQRWTFYKFDPSLTTRFTIWIWSFPVVSNLHGRPSAAISFSWRSSPRAEIGSFTQGSIKQLHNNNSWSLGPTP